MAVAKSDTILVDGHNVAGALKEFTAQANVEELDATVLSSTYRAYEPGFRTGSLDASGVYDSDPTNLDEIHDILGAAFNAGTAQVVTASLGNYAVGVDVIMLNGCVVKYDIPIPLGQLIMSNASFRATDGVNFGKWLISAVLAAGTTNGTAVDNGAATANGGMLHVHLHNDDASDVDVKVQHSTTGVGSWVDLTNVDNLSSVHTSGSAVVAKGTAVSRYLRAVVVVTGGDTFLVSAAFARR